MTQRPDQSASAERPMRWILLVLAFLAALAILSQFVLIFWARHELTQAESVVALHSASLASGRGVYFHLDRYPYTVSLYTPLFYVLSAGLQSLSISPALAGRLISFAALLGVILLSHALLRTYTGGDRFAVWIGTLGVASTANLVFWGTVGQVDVLGLCFSLAGFYLFARSRLVLAGCFVVLAVFTKQTLLAAPAAILVSVALEERRRAVRFALGTGGVGAILFFLLNSLTEGRFFDNTVYANVIPFSWSKLSQQVQYLSAAAGGILILSALGAFRALRPRPHPLFLYFAFSVLVLLATCPRIGADLNYQLETTTVAAIFAAWTLHKFDFFPRLFRADRGWVTLLHIPLLLHIVLNLAITGKNTLFRVTGELMRREEYRAIRPYLTGRPERVISVQLDPILHSGRSLEVEPLIYNQLVAAGKIDPEPVRLDLAQGRISLVVLYENVFEPNPGPRDLELPSLPENQLREIRKRYRLVAHVPGPVLDGNYLYQPRESGY